MIDNIDLARRKVASPKWQKKLSQLLYKCNIPDLQLWLFERDDGLIWQEQEIYNHSLTNATEIYVSLYILKLNKTIINIKQIFTINDKLHRQIGRWSYVSSYASVITPISRSDFFESNNGWIFSSLHSGVAMSNEWKTVL